MSQRTVLLVKTDVDVRKHEQAIAKKVGKKSVISAKTISYEGSSQELNSLITTLVVEE